MLVLIIVYIDESGTHDESPHLILGGWVARLSQWKTFNRRWIKLLKKYDLTHFHSKEFHHRQGSYAGWGVEKQITFLKTAEKITKKYTLFGFTFYLNKKEFIDTYLGDHTPQDLPLDSQYGVAFRSCLYFVPEIVQQALPGKDLQFRFVLESGHRNYRNADDIFHKVKKHAPSAFSDMLMTIMPGDKKDFPGLQVADVAAYNALHYEQNEPKMRAFDLPPDEIWQTARARSKTPIFRCTVNELELQKFKKRVLSRCGHRLKKRLDQSEGKQSSTEPPLS